MFYESQDLARELLESRSKKTSIKAARILLLLTGNQTAAKKIAEYRAEKAGIEDRNDINELVRVARANAAQRSADFKIQLAAIVDGMYGVCMATYGMEGDGATIFFSWELWKIAQDSLRQFATNPSAAINGNLGFPFPNSAVWVAHPEVVKAIFLPAWNYMEGQIEKHSETLEFLDFVNRLCPWNAADLDGPALEYFQKNDYLTPIERLQIEQGELALFQHYATTWIGCTRPTVMEYLLRASPTTLLPEARIWRFFYVHQRRIPILTLLMKRMAAAQAHSCAAERTGSLFTHDATAQTDAMSVETAVVRQRLHYAKVVNPMKTMPCGDLYILPAL